MHGNGIIVTGRDSGALAFFCHAENGDGKDMIILATEKKKKKKKKERVCLAGTREGREWKK